MRIPALVTLCMLMALPAFSQTRIVKGKLTVFNQYPLQNVEVASKKGKSVATTDSLGQFELVCNKKDVIEIKTPGFNSFNKKVSPNEDYVTANLIYKDSKKNRELVTDLGYIKADQLTYALTNLMDENNDFCNYSDIFSLLRTNFPELQQTGGAGGGAQGVYVRGQKSMSSSASNEAVYEVDGMIVKDISFVVPCNVSNIKIMKSGGTTVYGTQAVNGVIIIKTKGR